MFTCSVQLAGYPHEKFDDKGQITYDEFVTTFDTFPWIEQCLKYDEIKDGCSATVSISSIIDKKDLWASIAGDANKHIFLIGYNYMKQKKGFFGFGKEKTVKWVDIYEINDQEKIKQLFKLFFDKQFETLQSHLSLLKHFDSMKAYTQ